MRAWLLIVFALLLLVAISGCQKGADAAKQRADELLGSEKGVEVQAECMTDASCSDKTASTKDVCDFDGKCLHTEITACASGDGYCPPSCAYEADTDCATDECQSYTDCDDKKPQTADECGGTPKKCTHAEIKSCSNGDGLCPAGCNALSDDDCENLPADVKACKTASDCDDDVAETADNCIGEPKYCSHKVVKNCIDHDGVCPTTCSVELDTDCQDQCTTNADCNDGKGETLDKCEGRPKKCKLALVTECKNGDGVCLSSCDESNDSDCDCENGDKICPKTCDFRTDDDCPKKNLCETDYGCNDGLKYTNDMCIGTPKVCERTFITPPAGCGALDLNNMAAGGTVADCFCFGYNECDKLGITIVSDSGKNEFAYSVLDLDGDNCRLALYPRKLGGEAIDQRMNYQSVCSKLDVGIPDLVSPLRGGAPLSGAACADAVKTLFDLFPDTLLNQAANCRGNFTEYYAQKKGVG